VFLLASVSNIRALKVLLYLLLLSPL